MARWRSLARVLRQGWQRLPAWRRRLAVTSLALIGLVAVLSDSPIEVLVGSWLAANALLLLRLAFWLVMHPRVLLRARRPVLAWALAAGLVLTALLHAGIEPILAQMTEIFLPSGLIWLISIGFLLLAVTFGIGVGCVGVALGGLLGGREVEEERLARVGTAGIWLTLTAAMIVAGVLSRLGVPALVELAIAFGWPVLSLWLAPLVRHLEAERLSTSLHSWMSRHLVFRKKRRHGTRIYDLRALVLSLAGFVAAVLFAWAGFLNSLQSTVLLWMTREQSALWHLFSALDWDAQDPPEHTRIVLVTWDNAALHDARSQRSEAAVQTEVIERLAAWGARCIVVPLPSTEPERPAPPHVTPHLRLTLPGDEPAQPPADATPPPPPTPEATAAAARTEQDLPKLLQAAKACGCAVMVLAEHEFPRFMEEETGAPPAIATNLAGLRVGTDRLRPFRVASLPSLATTWKTNELPPIPWLVLDVAAGTNASPARTRAPQINPGAVLVDFRTCWPAEDFDRVPVSAILRQQPVPMPHTSARLWTPPAALLQRRIVFLEAASPQRRPTPVGELTRMEALAYATRTLLAETALRPVSAAWLGLWSCFWALAVGLTGAGRTLFGASARLVAAVVVIGTVSFGVFLLGHWLDPVFPIAAAGGAFLLVTQFSFALERRAKDHNRALLQRFVAPEVVEELLSDPEGNLGLGGRRERVVVLFADVRGFTQFAEEHSPEEVVKVVNAYLHVMTDALNHHGGLLDKYTGDGLMALFRISRSESEAVARSLAAALAMRDAVLALSADRQAGGARSLQVGIALHVGEAVLGLVGNPVRQINYTALGHAVVLAARLQGLAGGGEVLISEAVKEAAGETFQLAARDPVQVKGLSLPVNCYTVIERRAGGVVGSHGKRDKA